MSEQFYFNVMLAASSCMIITGIILAATKSPSDKRAAKFRMAKHAITIASIVLGILNFFQIGFDPDGDILFLGGCIALAVSFFQAFLFTMAVLVLIKPEEVTAKFLFVQIGAILVVDAMLIGSFFLFPLNVFFYFYELGIVIYVAMLIFYTYKYINCHKHFRQQIASYYEEEEIDRGLRWLNIIFWTALSVGILSLLMLFGNRDIDLILTLALALFYAFFAACFINYALSTPIILPALDAKTETTEVNSLTEEHPDKLMAWIERGGFLNTKLAVEDIAKELNMSVPQFRQYFKQVIGEDFRTWRVRKRIDYARLLMKQYPDWPITRIAQESGFNDRSYFYQQFLLSTGMSVSDYKKQIQPDIH
jgi:AraC-like DNA-binding protein